MSEAAATKTSTIQVTIDGKTITVEESVTIFQAAQRLGIDIPALCHRPDLDLNPVAVCRACMVDVGERMYPAACARPCGTLRDEKTGKAKPVQTQSPGVEAVRKTLLELLLAEHPRPCKRHQETLDCELELLGEKYGLLKPLRQTNMAKVKYPSRLAQVALGDDYGELFTTFPGRPTKTTDTTNFSIAVDHSACILCDRCVRACNDVAGHDIVGRMGKGAGTSVGFDNNKSMGDSDCVNCGWCMVACPTGALVYSGGQREGGFEDALTFEDMKTLPFIVEARVSPNFLRRYEGGIRVRQFKKGEVICKQRDRGHTAFYIDSGKVDIYIETTKPIQKSAGIFGSLLGLFASKQSVARSHEHGPISVDAGVDLTGDKLIAQIPDADSIASRLFGEASCRNGQPRSATVRAAEDTVVLEMQRDVLDILLRSPKFREDFDRTNRRRLIHNYLRSSPVFAQIPHSDLDRLEEKAMLVNYSAGQTIFNTGDPPDAFYLVRVGHVKVGLGGVVINYLSRGQFFGEISLLENSVRTTTCSALDSVELLRIGKTTFDQFVEKHPSVREELERAKNRRRATDTYRAARGAGTQSIQLQQYVKQELFEGQSLLLIDLDLCTRCDECVKACAQSHHGVARMIRDGQRFDHYLVPTACRSCHDPKCLGGCPVDAIHRTEEGGLAIVIEDHCIGCGFCFGEDAEGAKTGTGCPYGNIFPVPATQVDPKTGREELWRKAAVCDLDGCRAEHEEPSCVYACPHEAAQRVNAHEFFGKQLLREAAADSEG